MPEQGIKKQSEDRAEIEFRWEAIDIPTVYANQLVITHGGPEFYFVFGETVPIDYDNISEFPKTLVVKPRVRIAISREFAPIVVKAIEDNFNKFITRLQEITESQSDDSSNS